jgi:hypothetical protein
MRRSSCMNDFMEGGGDERDRTVGLSLAKAALSQLSYIPTRVALYRLPGGVSMIQQGLPPLHQEPAEGCDLLLR